MNVEQSKSLLLIEQAADWLVRAGQERIQAGGYGETVVRIVWDNGQPHLVDLTDRATIKRGQQIPGAESLDGTPAGG